MVELVGSYFTLAGDVFPTGPSEVSPHAFEDRLAAAAAAGFRGVGLVHADLLALRERLGLARLRALLDEHGLALAELELLVDWYADGERRERSDRVRAELLDAAAALGARHVKVAGDAGAAWPTGRLVEEFGRLCADAAAAGTSVVLEFMPFLNVGSLALAREVVEGAAAPNGGLLLDVWHVARSGVPYDELAALPSGTIGYVEIDDASAECGDDLFADTLHARRLCGEGDLDVAAFVRAVAAAGYDGPYGVEILSAEQRGRPLAEAARLAHDTARRQLELAGLA